jgi:hydroxymethylglutaryl-CoA lyase
VTSIRIREVGPRDGLQSEPPVDPADRARLVNALIDAGVREIEACSFVSPKAVPAMAGAAEVLEAAGRRDGVVYAALVPNVRGTELALAAGVDQLTVTVSASETYSQRNVGMSVDESVAAVGEICTLSSVPVDAVISFAFGSQYDEVSTADVARLCDRVRTHGVDALTLADTTGMGTPSVVREAVDAVGPDVGVHLHDTRGTALVNAYAALEAGVRRFDSAVGGLGGSPFAPGAGGNVATEELVYLFERLGHPTGIDLGALVAVTDLVAKLVGHPVRSNLSSALAG